MIEIRLCVNSTHEMSALNMTVNGGINIEFFNP